MPQTILYTIGGKPDATLKDFSEYFAKWIATPEGQKEFQREYKLTCDTIDAQKERQAQEARAVAG